MARGNTWITAKEAAEIISKNSERTVSDQHVRDYARKGKIKYRERDKRTNEYLKSDVERLRIRQNKRKQSVESEEQQPDAA
jgi:hypothetical protein